jgi:hypothetical protein
MYRFPELYLAAICSVSRVHADTQKAPRIIFSPTLLCARGVSAVKFSISLPDGAQRTRTFCYFCGAGAGAGLVAGGVACRVGCVLVCEGFKPSSTDPLRWREA